MSGEFHGARSRVEGSEFGVQGFKPPFRIQGSCHSVFEPPVRPSTFDHVDF